MKDYAQKQPPRVKRPDSGNSKKRSPVAFFLVLFILFLIVLFFAKNYKTVHSQKNTASSMAIPLSAQPLIQPSHSVESGSLRGNENSHFAFYTLLPKMAVSVPKRTEEPESHLLPTAHYLLQVAALAHYQEANQLRDQLVSMGYPAYIHTPTANQHWYLVLLGPYADTSEAEEDQERLYKKDHLDSLLLQHFQATQPENQPIKSSAQEKK